MPCSPCAHGRTRQWNMLRWASDLLPFSRDHRGTRVMCIVFETRNRCPKSAYDRLFRALWSPRETPAKLLYEAEFEVDFSLRYSCRNPFASAFGVALGPPG